MDDDVAAESRISGFTSTNNGSGTYTYDGEGRRVLKAEGATTTLYVYDAQGNRAAEYASAVAAPSCATCYETVDTLGSLRAVTDAFGNTIALHDYLPFGEELSTANRDAEYKLEATLLNAEASSGLGGRQF